MMDNMTIDTAKLQFMLTTLRLPSERTCGYAQAGRYHPTPF
ncbi:hypothetical protein VSX64_25035 [Aurantimonas sp. C2-6-R+9]|nr:hypothetical protein [Aurantimonas sp. C2-6-R+9]